MKRFTLIELLVTISVIAILAAMLLPVLGRAKLKAQEAGCLNNLKQIQLASVMYANENDDCVPPTSPNTEAQYSYLNYYQGGGVLAGQCSPTWCDVMIETLGLPIQTFQCPTVVAGDQQGPRTSNGNSAPLSTMLDYGINSTIDLHWAAKGPDYTYDLAPSGGRKLTTITIPDSKMHYADNSGPNWAYPYCAWWNRFYIFKHGDYTAASEENVVALSQNFRGAVAYFDGHVDIRKTEDMFCPSHIGGNPIPLTYDALIYRSDEDYSAHPW